MAVRREDFDLATGRIIFRAETQKQNADQVFHVHAQTRGLIERNWHDQEMLFPWPLDTDSHAQWQALRRNYRRILIDAGLPHDRYSMFHRLRKTTASLYAAQVGELEASSQLGHSSLEITKRYLDPTLMGRKTAADVLPRPIIEEAIANGQIAECRDQLDYDEMMD